MLTLRLLSLALQTASVPVAEPFVPGGIYSQGERAGWTISGTGRYTYSIRRNNAVEIARGEIDLNDGPKKIGATPNLPTMLYLELREVGGDRRAAFGAAIAPHKLQPTDVRPADFDSFWADKLKKMRRMAVVATETPGESYKPDVAYSTVTLGAGDGIRVRGALAVPKRPGKFPAMVILQWASPPYPLHPSWAIERAAMGYIAFNVQPHDVEVNAPREYYQSLPDDLKNYSRIAQRDRDSNYFVRMYLRGVRATDWLTKHPQWDGRVLVVNGTSMGGQQSFAVAALHDKVTHMITHVPAGADLQGIRNGRQHGYPFFPADDDAAMATARYIDAAHFAPRIRAKSLVSMGFVDTVTPPAGIWSAYNLIPGPKEAVPMIDAPHNETQPGQHRPYFDRSTEWMRQIAAGER